MTKLRLAGRRTFSSLRRHRNYRLFFCGQVVSVAGTWMQNVALAWLVLSLTHSATAVGALAVARFGPYMVLGLFGGVLADRIDNRKAVMGTQSVQLVAALGLAALSLGGIITLWEVYALAVLGGLAQIVDTPSRQSLTYQLVGRDELSNAIALNSTLFNIGRIAGPSIAGLLIAGAGLGWCFAVNAASFLAVLLGLYLMKPEELFPLERKERPKMWQGLREGARFVKETPRVLGVIAMITIFALLCFNFNVLLPVLAKQTLASGPQTFGIISATFGGGALLGALITAAAGRASLRSLMVGAALFTATQFALAPLRSTFWDSVLLFLTGVFFTVYTANSNTYVQLASPDHLRGRVLGIYYYAWAGLSPVGGILTGLLCDWGGTALAFYVAGAAGVLMVVGGYLYLRDQPPLPSRKPKQAALPLVSPGEELAEEGVRLEPRSKPALGTS
jgi:MFS family permease